MSDGEAINFVREAMWSGRSLGARFLALHALESGTFEPAVHAGPLAEGTGASFSNDPLIAKCVAHLSQEDALVVLPHALASPTDAFLTRAVGTRFVHGDEVYWTLTSEQDDVALVVKQATATFTPVVFFTYGKSSTDIEQLAQRTVGFAMLVHDGEEWLFWSK